LQILFDPPEIELPLDELERNDPQEEVSLNYSTCLLTTPEKPDFFLRPRLVEDVVPSADLVF